jgi:hypothetical protein
VIEFDKTYKLKNIIFKNAGSAYGQQKQIHTKEKLS